MAAWPDNVVVMTQNEQQRAALYDEAVMLADRARGWFDGPGQAWRRRLSPDNQALVAIESLGTTARLMAVMAWLLDPRGEAALGTAAAPAGLAEPGPIAAVLQGVAGGEIAARSRDLAARTRALADATR